MKNQDNGDMKRTIGLLSGVGILVGYVIGASIFITPGTLASQNGPSVWLSYLLAGAVAFALCFVYAQIGTMVPVSGGIYIFSSLTTTEYGGFLYVLYNAIIFAFGTPLMAITAATYLQAFFPSLNITITAFVMLLLTFVINIFGNKVSGKLQTAVIVFLVIILTLFTAAGIINADWGNFTPAFPVGVKPIIVGILACYYSFTGFNILTEMAGEVKNPDKNVPRIIFLGFALVMVLYVGVCVALVAAMPPAELGMGKPVMDAGSKILGDWFATAVGIAAICGAWTTLNACFLGLPRSFYQLGKSNLLPPIFAKLNKYGVPVYSLVLFTIIVEVSLIFSNGVLYLINMTSLFFLLIAILLSVGALRIKKTMKEEYDSVGYKLKGAAYYIWPILTIIFSTYIAVDFMLGDLQATALTVITTVIGFIAYVARKKVLQKKGIDLLEKMREGLTEE